MKKFFINNFSECNTKEYKSFFEKLTGTVHLEDEEQEDIGSKNVTKLEKKNNNNWIEEENDEAELTVDVYQTNGDIVIQAMVAGVKPEDLELTIARDMVTIRGKREEEEKNDKNFFIGKNFF